jgi:hypothetical protein
MKIEHQKTMVLISLFVIFGGLYFSYIFDRGGSRQSNTMLFSFILFLCLVSWFTTIKIKRWDEEKRTDYKLVYWAYFTFSVFLVFYFSYIVVSRSERECFIKLHGNIVNVCNIVSKGGGNIGQELGIYNEQGLDKEAIKRGFRNSVDIYRNIWKSMLIWKRDTSLN